MPYKVQYNYGYRRSVMATLDRVDADELRRELAIRRIVCEVPDCQSVAVGVLISGVAALACLSHKAEHASGGRQAASIEAMIKLLWQGIMSTVTAEAYSDAGQTIAVVYTGSTSIIDAALGALLSMDVPSPTKLPDLFLLPPSP